MGTSGSQLLVSPAYKYEQWEAVAAGVAKRVTNVCMVSDIYSDKCRQRSPPTHTTAHRLLGFAIECYSKEQYRMQGKVR